MHAFRDIFITRLLLTRAGIDTAIKNNLLRAAEFKKDQTGKKLETRETYTKSQKRISTVSDSEIIV